MSAEKQEDLGLGLGDFLGDSEATEETTEESTEETEVESEEASTDEEKVEETAEADKSEEPAESEEKEEEGEKPSLDFESDDNPYKEDAKKYKKHYEDTRVWANNVSQENLKLKEDFRRIEAKLDGTYDEESETPSPEDVQKTADLQGRIVASLHIAKDKYGADYIAENIDNPESEYQKMRQQNPLIDMRVTASETPYLEAVRILEEEKFFNEYGREPDLIKENITKQVEADLREKITKEFKDKLKVKEDLPKGTGELRGAVLEKEDKPTFTPDPLGEIFQH